MPERILVIDTSGAECSVALIEGGRVLADRHEVMGRGHAECLLPWIAALPDGGRADLIIVGCGPGSFTGVRVGIAAARGLALGWDIPVKGISSLELIAADACQSGAFLVATEAGHGEVFVQPFSASPHTVQGGMMALRPEDVSSHFVYDVIVGSGAARVAEAQGCGVAYPASARAAALVELPIAAANLAPSPIYGRAPDAKPAAA